MHPDARRSYLSPEVRKEGKQRSATLQNLLIQASTPGPVLSYVEKQMILHQELKPCSLQESFIRNTNEACKEQDIRTDPFIEEVGELFEMAHDDNVFTTLSLLFDATLDMRFEKIVGWYTEKHMLESVTVTPIMKDVLKYAHWKCFGVKDLTEHIEREQRLMCIADVLKQIREVLGLENFTTLRWRFV